MNEEIVDSWFDFELRGETFGAINILDAFCPWSAVEILKLCGIITSLYSKLIEMGLSYVDFWLKISITTPLPN